MRSSTAGCGAGLSGPTWTGCVSTDWNTAGNWASGTVPTAIDNVVIPSVTNQPVIGNGTSAAGNSVEVQTGASLSIVSGGSLTLNGSKSVGGNTTAFYNNGTVNNSGQLVMGNTAAIGAFGLYNYGTFTNNAGGAISIDRATDFGLFNDGSSNTFTNSATITIGSLGTIGGTGIRNEGPFANSACATLTVLAPIINYNNSPSNSNSFSNAGLITVNTAQAHTNTRTLTNNGIIAYPQGNPIPNVVNNDVIASAISSCSNTISPALQLGGNSNQFTVGTTWYKDQALTQPAGTYNQGANTFTATNLVTGSTTLLYFSATDGTNNCTQTVALSVTINPAPVLSIAAAPSPIIVPGQSTTLTASRADTYRWSTGETTATILVSIAGTYSLTGTTSAGCSATISTGSTASFAITGVSLLNCTPINPNRYVISFSPQYMGLNGQPVSFQVVNENLPTTDSGPYSLQLYTDNPSITLKAVQNGATASYVYNWLAVCGGARLGAADAGEALSVVVLGNPTQAEEVEIMVRGATGSLTLVVTDSRGRRVSEQVVEPVTGVTRTLVRLGNSGGVYLLEVRTATQQRVVKVIRQ